MDSQPFFDVAASVERVGQYQWLEQRLFELMGSLISDTDDPEVAFFLGSQSFHHEFLAEQWARRLGHLGGEASAVQAPRDAVRSLFEPQVWAGQPIGACLAGLYRTVLPRLAGIYSAHLSSIDPALSGATARVLNLAGNDYRADWVAGEFFTQKYLESDEMVSDAVRFRGELELALGAGPGLI